MRDAHLDPGPTVITEKPYPRSAVRSGQHLDAFFQQHIFGPLGMRDTAFEVPPEKQSRLALIYERGTDGNLAPKPAAIKEEPGFLTIVCNPYCDDVVDQGRSLGPSPVVHLSVPPGQHRITLKKGKDAKVISVVVVAGQAIPKVQQPADLVTSLLYLCDPGSGFVTGAAINADGGFAKH